MFPKKKKQIKIKEEGWDKRNKSFKLYNHNEISVKEVNAQPESTKSGRRKTIFSRFTQKQLQIHDGTKK